MSRKVILASASPRRREILERAGIPFTVQVADVVEVRALGEPAVAYVRRLAREKAAAVPGAIVLGADTTVEVDGEVLEKPVDAADADRMLARLSGRMHWVHTGICLRTDEVEIVDHASTAVWFLPVSDQERRWYGATGEPLGKAGGYAIQGVGSRFVERIEGCYFNVVGLPVSLVWKHLRPLLTEPGDEGLGHGHR